MTLIFYLKPKFFDVGGLNRGYLADQVLKKKSSEKEEVVEEVLEEEIIIEPSYELEQKQREDESLRERLFYTQNAIKTLELEASIMEKIKFQEAVLQARKLEIAKLVEEMREEEEMILMMLLED